MFSRSFIMAIVLVLGCSVSVASDEISADERAFFEQHIRPTLTDNCLRCHSAAKKKRKGGLLLDRKAGWMEGGDSGEAVITPGKPDKSLLIKMIQHDPEVEAMPPKKKLSKEQIAKVIEWVKMGAPDPRNESMDDVVEHKEFDLEQRKTFWSLQPLKKVSVPQVENASWPRNDYDRFLLAKLEERQWKPAEPTDKATLLRRASITLTGLAPTVEEMESFLKDDQPGAYERQVDRLLASPHFGERFARHWMDVVRYADSKAFEADYTIPYGNEFRDYLIRSFNADVSFDQFVKEAFAGDLLENPRIVNGINESVIGPGFLLTTDGHHGPPDLHEDESRLFDGMINTATVAFQGLTVSCAKCHDHKFDAITTADYYSLYGIFRSSRLHYANVSTFQGQHHNVLKLLDALVQRLATTAIKNTTLDPKVIQEAIAFSQDPDLSKLLKDPRHSAKAIKALLPKKMAPDTARWFEFLFLKENIPELNSLRRALTRRGPKAQPVKVNTRYQWNAIGPGAEKIQGPKYFLNVKASNYLRGALDKGYAIGRLASSATGVIRSKDFILDGKPVELWLRGRGAAVNLIIRNYELAGRGPTTNGLRVTVNSDSLTRVRFNTHLWKGESAYLEIQHQAENMKCLPPGKQMGRPEAQAYVALPETFTPAAWTGKTVEEIVAEIPHAHPEVLGQLFARGLLKASPSFLRQTIKVLQKQLPQPRYVRSLTDGSNYHEPVYIRGNHKTPSKQPNPKHFLDAFGGPLIGKGGSGRLEYAEHLVTTTADLTARVRVNRLWTRIFGRGLVGSPDDFGLMGDRPTHPELLDYMAQRFIDRGWSTKTLIRELVTSSTFRMSSVPSSGVRQADPKNTLLQHMPMQRMDAESIRDHILHVSGDLDRQLYGASVKPYIDDLPRSRAWPGSGKLGGHGRRSLYLQMQRNYLPSFLRAFNLPQATAPVGQRQVTNVPAQSLTLLNHPFVHQQAKSWAQKLTGTTEERLHQMHLLAFSRKATEAEIAWGQEALAKVKTWEAMCHLMFNRKELIYVF